MLDLPMEDGGSQARVLQVSFTHKLLIMKNLLLFLFLMMFGRAISQESHFDERLNITVANMGSKFYL